MELPFRHRQRFFVRDMQNFTRQNQRKYKYVLFVDYLHITGVPTTRRKMQFLSSPVAAKQRFKEHSWPQLFPRSCERLSPEPHVSVAVVDVSHGDDQHHIPEKPRNTAGF